MSAPSNSLRQRGGQSNKKASAKPETTQSDDSNGVLKSLTKKSGVSSEWDFKIALAIITVLAFATRFWGIGHPNEVVFDEVHFGKVGSPWPDE